MNWRAYDGNEHWSGDDRFGVLPCPNGFWCRDQRTNDASPTFATVDEAKRWAEEQLAAPPFDGNTLLTTTTAGKKSPPPPGTTGEAP